MEFYDRDSGAHGIAAAYDEQLVPWLFAHWAEHLVFLASPGRSAKVVDLACGTGLMARSFLDHLGDDGRVYGVDLDEAMLGYAAMTLDDDRVSWHGPVHWLMDNRET